MFKQFKLLKEFLILLTITIVATSGYMYIEGWSLLDSIYMTVITISTIGYREVGELSTQGKIFNIFVIVTGVSSGLYVLNKTFQQIIENGLKNFRKEKNMQSIEHLRDHTVICGYGIMGQKIAHELKQKGQKLIVIEKDVKYREHLEQGHTLHLFGNAEDDDVLIRAGIKHAKYLVSVASTDASNVFITLTAKNLNAEVSIISRALEESSIDKLKKAGADRVISPYSQASISIVQHILTPSVIDFVEVMSGNNIDFQMADLEITNISHCLGKTIAEIQIEDKQLSIVGIKKSNGAFVFAPPLNYHIELNDHLIILGNGKDFANEIQSLA